MSKKKNGKKNKKAANIQLVVPQVLHPSDLAEYILTTNPSDSVLQLIRELEFQIGDIEFTEKLCMPLLNVVLGAYAYDATFLTNELLDKSSEFVIVRKDELAKMAAVVNSTSRMISGPVDLPESVPAKAVVLEMKKALGKKLFHDIFVTRANKMSS
jgi:hypothetical protein